MKHSDILIIQPVIAGYRRPFFNGLFAYFKEVVIIAGLTERGSGFDQNVAPTSFKTIYTPTWRFFGGRLYWQTGVIGQVARSRPFAIFTVADFRAIHFWFILLLAPILNIKLYAHGHGLFRKTERKTFFLHRIAQRYVVSLANSYVCYNYFVRDQLCSFGMPKHKLSVVRNTLEEISVTDPRTKIFKPRNFIFVGRIRAGNGLDLLFDAMGNLGKNSCECKLAIIGDGPDLKYFQRRAKEMGLHVDFHGPIHDSVEIARIANDAQIGIYPGDAGLSVIHYMALGLVPVTHNNMACHMGPEPTELSDGENARLFERGNSLDLTRVLTELIDNPLESKTISVNAFDHYIEMTQVSMAKQLAKIIDSGLKNF